MTMKQVKDICDLKVERKENGEGEEEIQWLQRLDSKLEREEIVRRG